MPAGLHPGASQTVSALPPRQAIRLPEPPPPCYSLERPGRGPTAVQWDTSGPLETPGPRPVENGAGGAPAAVPRPARAGGRAAAGGPELRGRQR